MYESITLGGENNLLWRSRTEEGVTQAWSVSSGDKCRIVGPSRFDSPNSYCRYVQQARSANVSVHASWVVVVGSSLARRGSLTMQLEA